MKYLSGRWLIAIVLIAGIILMAGQQSSLAATAEPQINIDNPDLAFTIIPGDVILYWTATGDDGEIGRATSYDLRYLPADQGPIDSEGKWNQAIQISREPVPSYYGQVDSMLVRGLAPGESYYFCIKAIDDAGNSSPISNSPLKTSASLDFYTGDVNNSGTVDGIDIIYLVNYLKGGPPPPEPFLRADCNGSCDVSGPDVNYLLIYLRGGGTAPRRGDCLPILSKPGQNRAGQNQ
jgi:hypothetical protein